jgi:hypothetical protein
MLELGSGCFDQICGDAAVRAQLATLDDRRQAAVRRFWIATAAGLLAAAASCFLLVRFQWGQFGWVGALLCILAGVAFGIRALSSVAEALKGPALAAIAAKAGMLYVETGFTPFAYSEARQTLFGRSLSKEIFTDLFHGEDEAGRGYAFYEADLVRGSGRTQNTVFRGQIYAVERRAAGGGTTAIVPDRGLFNFFKPAAGMIRVKLDSDPDFEGRFEIYSTSRWRPVSSCSIRRSAAACCCWRPAAMSSSSSLPIRLWSRSAGQIASNPDRCCAVAAARKG